MPALDAWTTALCEDGSGEVAAICERAYGLGFDLVDLDGIRRGVKAGQGAAILAEMPELTLDPVERIESAVQKIIQALS